MEALVKTSISSMVRCGLPSPTRKVAIGLLFTGLASALVLAICTYSVTHKVSYAQTGPDRLGVESGPISDAENVKIKEFMERVALSYVANTRTATSPLVTAVAERSRPTISTSDRSLARTAFAPRRRNP
jgi:hypothetical protein